MVSNSRDGTYAYMQFHKTLERNVYIRPPTEMRLRTGKTLKAIEILYGIPESGLYWYLKYVDHHCNKPRMSQSRADPCILHRCDENGLYSMVIWQVDDSLIIGR